MPFFVAKSVLSKQAARTSSRVSPNTTYGGDSPPHIGRVDWDHLSTSGYSMRKFNRAHAEGFTLVEVLITLAIVGVIGAFALSSMTNAVRNANFVDLKDAASRFAIAQQSHRQIFNRFADQVSNINDQATSHRIVFSDSDKYNVNVLSTSYNEFTADLSVKDSKLSPTDNCHTVRVNSRLGILKFDSFSKNGNSNTTAECLNNG